MALIRIAFRPGIDKQNTEYGAEGGWIDSDYVRFRYGLPEKMGGWQPFAQQQVNLIGKSSDMLSWNSLAGVPYMAVGTSKKLYVFTGGSWYDITPIRDTDPAITFDTVSGSNIVTVNSSGHGLSEGDFVIISSVTGDPGGILNAELENQFQVQTVPSGSTFTIAAPVNATSTETADGSGTATFQIPVGSEVSYFDFGWGVGGFGVSPYGEPVPAVGGFALSARVWQLDTYGEDLIAQISGGEVYKWSPSQDGVSTPASRIVGAPTKNNYALISTPDRHLVVFGTETIIGDPTSFDPMFVRFSNQEDIGQFEESAINTAGGQRLTDGSKIFSAVRSRGQILIFTDTSLHGMQFIGPPYTFGFQQLGANCGIIGPHGAVDVNGITLWMGQENFFVFDGTVKKLPCTVQDFVFQDINLVQGAQVFAGSNGLFNEVTWWYCTSGALFPDRFVTYNYLENTWHTGTMARTSWQDIGTYSLPSSSKFNSTSTAIPPGNTIYGLSAGRSVIYTQEIGYDGDGSPIISYIQSGYFDLGDGDNLMYVKRFVPDYKKQRGDIVVQIKLRAYPAALATVSSLDPYVVSPSTQKIDTRARGRQVSILMTSLALDTWWRFGTLRIDAQPDGLR